MRQRSWRFGVCLALALAAADPSNCRAENIPSRPHVVVLQQEGESSPLRAGLVAALRAHLVEFETPLEVRTLRTLENPVVVASLLRSEPQVGSEQAGATTYAPLFYTWLVQYPPKVIVYIYEPEGPHLRAREVLPSDSPAAAAEELALILRSAVSAHIAGSPLELGEVPLPTPKGSAPGDVSRSGASTGAGAIAAQSTLAPLRGRDEPTISSTKARSESPEPIRFGAFTGYGYAPMMGPLLRGNSFQGGPSVRLFLQSSTLRVSVGYLALLPLTVHNESAEVTLSRHPMQLVLEYDFLEGPTRLGPIVHLLADPVQRRTLSATPPLSAEPNRTRWQWALGLGCQGELPLPFGLRLAASARAELGLNPYSIELNQGGHHEVLATSLAIRPVMDLGLVWVTR